MSHLADCGVDDFFGANSVLLTFGHEFEELAGHTILVTCSGGDEIVYQSGNYLMKTRLTVRSPADREPGETTVQDPREKHRALVQAVREAMFTTTIEADLSKIEPDFTANLVIDGGSDSGV